MKCKNCGGTGFVEMHLGPVFSRGSWDGNERRGPADRRHEKRLETSERRRFQEVLVPLYQTCDECDKGREIAKRQASTDTGRKVRFIPKPKVKRAAGS